MAISDTSSFAKDKRCYLPRISYSNRLIDNLSHSFRALAGCLGTSIWEAKSLLNDQSHPTRKTILNYLQMRCEWVRLRTKDKEGSSKQQVRTIVILNQAQDQGVH